MDWFSGIVIMTVVGSVIGGLLGPIVETVKEHKAKMLINVQSIAQN